MLPSRYCDFFTKSTLSWALEKCSEKKGRFCEEMALSGNFSFASIFTRKRVSLGRRYLFYGCQRRSPRVFEIFTRKRVSLDTKELVLLLPMEVTSSV